MHYSGDLCSMHPAVTHSLSPSFISLTCEHTVYTTAQKNVCTSLTCLLHTADSHSPILFQTPVHLFHLSPSLQRSLRYLNVKNAERMDLTQTWQM